MLDLGNLGWGVTFRGSGAEFVAEEQPPARNGLWGVVSLSPAAVFAAAGAQGLGVGSGGAMGAQVVVPGADVAVP